MWLLDLYLIKPRRGVDFLKVLSLSLKVYGIIDFTSSEHHVVIIKKGKDGDGSL